MLMIVVTQFFTILTLKCYINFRCSSLDENLMLNHRVTVHEELLENIKLKKYKTGAVGAGYYELYQCPNCPCKTFTLREMSKHKCEAYKNETALSKQASCKTISSTEANHEEDEPNRAGNTENNCTDKAFAKIKTIHVCPEPGCKYTSLDKQIIDCHNEKCHVRKFWGYACPCGFQFSCNNSREEGSEALKQHRVDIHEQDRNTFDAEEFKVEVPSGYCSLFKCPKCEARGFTPHDLRQHPCRATKSEFTKEDSSQLVEILADESNLENQQTGQIDATGQTDVDTSQVEMEDQRMDVEISQVDTECDQTDLKMSQVETEGQQTDTDMSQIHTNVQQTDADKSQVETESKKMDVNTSQVDDDDQQTDVNASQIDDKDEQTDSNTSQVNDDSQQTGVSKSQVDDNGQQTDVNRSKVGDDSQQTGVITSQVNDDGPHADGNTSGVDKEGQQKDAKMNQYDAESEHGNIEKSQNLEARNQPTSVEGPVKEENTTNLSLKFCPEEGCVFAYCDSQNLLVHKLKVHTLKYWGYQCTCGTQFSWCERAFLKEHRERDHGDDKQLVYVEKFKVYVPDGYYEMYQCPEERCIFESFTIEDLEKHKCRTSANIAKEQTKVEEDTQESQADFEASDDDDIESDVDVKDDKDMESDNDDKSDIDTCACMDNDENMKCDLQLENDECVEHDVEVNSDEDAETDQQGYVEESKQEIIPDTDLELHQCWLGKSKRNEEDLEENQQLDMDKSPKEHMEANLIDTDGKQAGFDAMGSKVDSKESSSTDVEESQEIHMKENLIDNNGKEVDIDASLLNKNDQDMDEIVKVNKKATQHIDLEIDGKQVEGEFQDTEESLQTDMEKSQNEHTEANLVVADGKQAGFDAMGNKEDSKESQLIDVEESQEIHMEAILLDKDRNEVGSDVSLISKSDQEVNKNASQQMDMEINEQQVDEEAGRVDLEALLADPLETCESTGTEVGQIDEEALLADTDNEMDTEGCE